MTARKNAAGILFILTFFFYSTATGQKRPNILWITCEDISPTLSFYGDNTAKTPVLDKLASESRIYTNAFAPVAVCAPSRSAIITGMYPTSIGTMHMRTGRDVSSWGLREYDGESNAVDIAGNDVPHYSVVTPPEVKCFPEYLRAAGYFTTNNHKTDYQFAAPRSAWDQNSQEAHWRNRQKDQPFFSVFNFTVTHESRIWANADKELTVDPETVPLPPYYPDNPIVRQDVARNYSNIELLDQQVGELLEQLKADDLMDNTIIFFFSDHGGPLPRGKRENYDSGLKVPFLVRLPDSKETMKVDELISFVDLAPTVLSLAGLDVPEHLQGDAFLGDKKEEEENKYIFASGDRFDEFSDRTRVVRGKKFMYIRNFHPELPRYKDVAYRKQIPMMNELLRLNKEGSLNPEQELYFVTSKPSEEFYDVENDPYQLNNLINNQAYSDQINEMRRVLDEFLISAGDKGLEPELSFLYEIWPNGQQPVTEDPVAVRLGKKVVASTTTEGASISYLISDEEIDPDLNAPWQLYTEPVRVGKKQRVYFQAGRIGYRDSKVVELVD